LDCEDSHEEDKEEEEQLLKDGTKERKYGGLSHEDNHIENERQH
jgi:hypothetical protein